MALRHRTTNAILASTDRDVRFPTELSDRMKGKLQAKLRDVIAHDAQMQTETDDLHELRADLIDKLATFGPDELAEMVDACGLGPKLPAVLPASQMTSGITSRTGTPEAPTEDIWGACLAVLADYQREDPHGFSRGMTLASKRPLLRAHADGVDTIGKKAAAAAAKGAVAGHLSSLAPQERREVVRELLEMPTSDLRTPARRLLLEWGSYIASAAPRFAAAPQVDLEKEIDRCVDALYERSAPHVKAASPALRDECTLVVAVAAGWALCGFPTLQPTHKLAASLMATYLPADLLPDLQLPWDTFAITVPDGLLEPLAPEGVSLRIALTGLCLSGGRLHLWTAFDRFGELHLTPLPNGLRDLIDGAHLTTPPTPGSLIQELLGRLILGCLIELDQPAGRAEVARGAPRPSAPKRKGDLPSAWTFVMRRDVRVDLRTWVRNYAAGNHRGSSPGVQVLVRGHHKRQPHGPQQTLRKWIHVEPYWRGDDALPIAIRSHKLLK